MPNPTTKSRQELRSRFVRNAIPSEADFADLIGASLNQVDDGLFKLSDGSLGLVRQGQNPEQPVLRFFADPAAEGATWQLQLASGDKPSFGLMGADGKAALAIDGATGRVGIGLDSRLAEAKLHVAGGIKLERSLQFSSHQEIVFADNGQIRSLDNNHRLLFRRSENKLELREYGDIILSSGSKDGTETAQVVLLANGNVGIGDKSPGNRLTIQSIHNSSKDPESAMLYGGSLAIKSNAPQIDLIDTDGNDWSIHVNENRLHFIRQPWEHSDLVLDGAGSVGIGTTTPGCKLDVNGSAIIRGSIFPSFGGTFDNGILFASDDSGMSYDSAWIRYYREPQELSPGYSPKSFDPSMYGFAGRCVLEIGIGDDHNDYIYLNSSGGVKIDVLRLGEKFRLSGVGDHEANDSWLRLKNISNTEYYGGIAAKRFWTFDGQYLSSDITLKRDIAPIQGALECLLKMRGVWFSWKESCDNETEKTGLIAQEVEQVFPELVKMGPDHKLGVDYIGLIPVLIESIKSQQEQLMQLRSDYEKLAHLR